MIPKLKEYKDDRQPTIHDKKLMSKIIKYGKIHWRVSPLAENRELYRELKDISKERWVEFWLMVGMSYAESHIAANYSPKWACSISHNRAGMKRDKRDDGSLSKKYDQQYKELPEEIKNELKWCYVYYFPTYQEWRRSFANLLKYGYIEKGCDTPECISRYRVRNDWAVKTSRSSRVNIFRNN